MNERVATFLGKKYLKLYYHFTSCISRYSKSLFKSCGKNVNIARGGVFTYDKISIGDDVFMNVNVVIISREGGGDICIGNHVSFGPGVNIYGINHNYRQIGSWIKDVYIPEEKNVTIEDDVWVGANAIILPGVTIGKGSVIAAGAVVTKDIAPYTVYMGIPSQKISNRFTPSEIDEHEGRLNI